MTEFLLEIILLVWGADRAVIPNESMMIADYYLMTVMCFPMRID